MATYLEILNDNGTIQITDQFKNLQFLYKGTSVSGNTVTIGVNEILAIRSDDGNWCTIYDPSTNAQFCHLTQDGLSKICPLYGTGTIYYYVFGFTSNTAGKFFEVRDANNQVVFSDSSPYMQAIWQANGADGSMVSKDTIICETVGRSLGYITHSSSQKLAVIPSALSFVWQVVPHGIYMVNASFSYSTIDANTEKIECKYIQVKGNYEITNTATFHGVAPNYWFGMPAVSYLVIDISNL